MTRIGWMNRDFFKYRKTGLLKYKHTDGTDWTDEDGFFILLRSVKGIIEIQEHGLHGLDGLRQIFLNTSTQPVPSKREMRRVGRIRMDFLLCCAV
ncbi:MAG: hypothetical protein JNM19_09170 [Chitinophagaceae bacterium]|nr:hypothetical protein [Chitinophagaceae bacterium]